MKKKLFAFLTAVCCLTGSVASLSAYAKNFDESEFYIVSQVKTYDSGNNFCYMYSYCKNRNSYISDCFTEYFQLISKDIPNITGNKLPSDYEYGDIVTFDNSDCWSVDHSFPPQYYVGIFSKELHYIGNCRDLLETKELTLKNRENYYDYTFDKSDYIDFTFTDEEGKEYQYRTYYYTNDPEIDIDSCAIGDTVTFSVYNDTAILPLELHRNVIPGDADRNGKFDILDVIYLNRVILGRDIISDVNIDIIDFNQDGVPDSSDALTMLKMLVGLA